MRAQHPVDLAFLAALSAFLAVLTVGVVRRWRRTFWLIPVAFLAGVLRVPAGLLALLSLLPTVDPPWYVIYQALMDAHVGRGRGASTGSGRTLHYSEATDRVPLTATPVLATL